MIPESWTENVSVFTMITGVEVIVTEAINSTNAINSNIVISFLHVIKSLQNVSLALVVAQSPVPKSLTAATDTNKSAPLINRLGMIVL